MKYIVCSPCSMEKIKAEKGMGDSDKSLEGVRELAMCQEEEREQRKLQRQRPWDWNELNEFEEHFKGQYGWKEVSKEEKARLDEQGDRELDRKDSCEP